MAEIIDFAAERTKRGYFDDDPAKLEKSENFHQRISELKISIKSLEEEIKRKNIRFYKLSKKVHERMHYYGLTKNNQEINEYDMALDKIRELKKTIFQLKTKKKNYQIRLNYLEALKEQRISELKISIKSLEEEIKDKDAQRKALDQEVDKSNRARGSDCSDSVSDQELISRLKIELWDLKIKKSKLMIELEKLKDS